MIQQIQCTVCDKSFIGPRNKKYCSSRCKISAARAALPRQQLTYRAQRAGARIVEEVDPAVVYQRDRGLCYLCNEFVDRSAPMGPTYATVDHVVPMSKGGVHSYANVKLAHLGCNARKQDHIVDIVGFELRGSE